MSTWRAQAALGGVLPIVVIVLFLVVAGCGNNQKISERGYAQFARWGLAFDYPKELQEHAAHRVAMMKEAIGREVRSGGGTLQEFTYFVGPKEEISVLVMKYTLPKMVTASEFVEERSQFLESAMQWGDVTKVNHVKETTIAQLPAVEEDFERGQIGRSRTFKVIDGATVYSVSFIVAQASQFAQYSTVLDALVSSIKVADEE